MLFVKNLIKYKCVIFDCDGVILDSNKIKTKAFEKTLIREPTYHIEKFINYHKHNGGVSRYEKFNYFFSQIKKENIEQSKLNNYLSEFSEILKEELISCNLVPGVIRVLEYLLLNNIDCFVISGGDQIELNYIFKEKKLNKYFIKILGSPVSKDLHTLNLLKKKEIQFPILFFGDSKLDMEIAFKNGFDFCYVRQFSEWQNDKYILQKNIYDTIFNFDEIF